MWLVECQEDQDHDYLWNGQEIGCSNLRERAVNKIGWSHSG